jgi:hypothetical protein
MTRLATTPAIFGILVGGMFAAGLLAGCSSKQVEIGAQNMDAHALDAPAGSGGAGAGTDAAVAGRGGATGGVTGAGGVGPSGGIVGSGGVAPSGGTTGVGSGGSSGAGGSSKVTASGGTSGSGGTTRSGGTIASGGTTATGTGCAPDWTLCCGQCLSPFAGVCQTPCPPAGGAGATGGSTGAGGSSGTGKTCGGIAGVSCPAGQFCDLQAGSCNVADATGTCVANAGLGCITIYQPVCGCNGKTYPSDCDRQVAGVSKKSDGVCPTGDASTGSCSQVTTRAECDSRSDCHSVFQDPGTCGCAPAGCCARFNRCADGGRANCTGPVAFGCTIAPPFCELPYVLSYTANCYEGCVLQSECAGADAGVGGTAACQQVGTLDQSCIVDSDCLAVRHTTNCCGTSVWLGINKAGGQEFSMLESLCDASYPVCGCAGGPPTTSDGSSLPFGTNAAVTCQGGVCRTYASACGHLCETGRSCITCGQADAGVSVCSLRCTGGTGCTEAAYSKCMFTYLGGVCVAPDLPCSGY